VFPNKEAAKRVSPLLLSSVLLNYLPVSGKLVLAELAVPESMIGKTILQIELRKKYGLNLISVRTEDKEFDEFNLSHIFQRGDIGLFSGTDEALGAFTGSIIKEQKRGALYEQLLRLFRKEKKR
jgi:trk system potassium uptake protein TrkA